MTTTYRFVSFRPYLTDFGHNKLYVEAFVGALNERDFVRHQSKLNNAGEVLPPMTQGWSWGIPPRYFDGRITTRRTSWVFARKDLDMPEEACAMVYFTTEEGPIGYLVKE